MTDFELETWIVEVGDGLIKKEAAVGRNELTPVEQLIYCLWVADYGMRNAGDLQTASDLYGPFQTEAAELAASLGLPKTQAAFELSTASLEREYFGRLADVVSELRGRYVAGTQ